MFLSSYRNTSGSLGEREMLWEHEPQASVSKAFSSALKRSRCFYLTTRLSTTIIDYLKFQSLEDRRNTHILGLVRPTVFKELL